MSTKHAILGVLMQCPSHGYQIKKLFAPFISKNGLNDGQVYPMLTQLEKDELVQKEVVRQEKSPNKNIYHITERGREVFLQWLTGSEDETDPIKYDFFMQYRFLMKCNFFEHLSKEERVEKLRRQIETAKEKISEYERMREEMVERGLSNYKSKIVGFGIDTQMLKIRWADSLLKEELGKPPRAVKARRNSKRATLPRNARKTTTKKG